MGLDDAEQQAAQDRARQGAHAAQHHRDKALEGRPQAEERRDLLVRGQDGVAGDPAHQGHQREGAQHGPCAVDAHVRGRQRVFGPRAQGQAEPGAVQQEMQGAYHDRGQHQHRGLLRPEEKGAHLVGTGANKPGKA